jgi:dihydrofolate synthase/folylpolyglutamate synthase
MYYFTNANIARALPANELQIQASKHGLVGNSYSIVELAVLDAINSAASDDLVLIIGSNFIVGEAITALKKINQIINI